VSNKRAAVNFERGLPEKAVQRELGDEWGRARFDDETGAVLLLALAYIIAISLIVGALADWAMNDLNNTTHFNSTSQLHIAVSSVTNLAIQNIRYTPDPSNPTSSPTPVGPCWTPAAGGPANVSQYLVDTYTVAVWCTTSTAFASEQTRTVTLYACLSSLTSGSSTITINAAMASCQTTQNLLTAIVVFDDYPPQGAPGQTKQCNLGLGQCGEGMKLLSWLW
jgi:hypothetical protein